MPRRPAVVGEERVDVQQIHVVDGHDDFSAGLHDRLAADPEVAGRISAQALDAAMDSRAHLKELDRLFTRVFGEPGPSA